MRQRSGMAYGCVLGVLLLAVTDTHARSSFSFSSDFSSSGEFGSPPSAAWVGLTTLWGYDASTWLFKDISLTPADIGSTYTLPNDDPRFDPFASYLVNGNDDPITILYGPVGEGGVWRRETRESACFGANFSALRGKTIESMSMRLDALSIAAVATGWSIQGNVTFSFATVPEPSAWFLLGTGLLAAAWLQRRSKR